MISSYAGAELIYEIVRYDKKEKTRIKVDRPFCIQEYNKFMGGVDFMDRLISHYPHGFKNKKWYLRIFFQFMNIAIVNAWILYRQSPNPPLSLLRFKASIATSLTQLNSTAERLKKKKRSSFKFTMCFARSIYQPKKN
ncbi:piggyBac transposable element-derived protein 3-like [Melanaphis sacchari]|uniref:piggyBac transposable element-derived protein 3-like n=1 Tax=Melanaphis sacchari TaxID=742174 RepID=UPI000DC13302|nr:piggyBac transposable element-derived protein 3-like [Melanaphis sacchari]